ncbi:unnamed protein product, partial [Chrysoparadoxa australica]
VNVSLNLKPAEGFFQDHQGGDGASEEGDGAAADGGMRFTSPTLSCDEEGDGADEERESIDWEEITMATAAVAEADAEEQHCFLGPDERVAGKWNATLVMPQCLLEGHVILTSQKMVFEACSAPRQIGSGPEEDQSSPGAAGAGTGDMAPIIPFDVGEDYAAVWQLDSLTK